MFTIMIRKKIVMLIMKKEEEADWDTTDDFHAEEEEEVEGWMIDGDADGPGCVADEVDEDDGDEQDRVGLQLGKSLRAHTGDSNQDDADIYHWQNWFLMVINW